jgi:hypothetical protein
VIRLHAFALILLVGTVRAFAQPAMAIEDTVAGITVGKSTLADVQRMFGTKLALYEGRHGVRWDGACEIFFDLEDKGTEKPSSLVENIQLLNLGKGADKNSPCNRIATGRGLRLSDSPNRVRALYGPANTFVRNNMVSVGYNSKPRCPQGSKKAVVFRNMGVEWVPGSQELHDIDLGITKTDCSELTAE